MILFHGCGMREAGHYWFGPGMESGRCMALRRRHNGRIEDNPYRFVPWGHAVDGGLAPQGKLTHVEGAGAFAQAGRFLGTPEEEWWSAISWWDNSVDHRPASNATFVIDAKIDSLLLLDKAREAFPEVLARMKYPIKWAP